MSESDNTLTLRQHLISLGSTLLNDGADNYRADVIIDMLTAEEDRETLESEVFVDGDGHIYYMDGGYVSTTPAFKIAEEESHA